MSTPQIDRRLAGLFAAALLGVLVVLGLLAAALGTPVLVGYVAVVVPAPVLLVRRARALQQPAAPAAEGRTCSCCTSTVFDPVEVR